MCESVCVREIKTHTYQHHPQILLVSPFCHLLGLLLCGGVAVVVVLLLAVVVCLQQQKREEREELKKEMRNSKSSE